jgi:plastocyanin
VDAIRIVAVDRAFEPDALRLPAGKTVTIEITNQGNQPHDFAIRALDLNTGLIRPGEVATATFAVPPETIQFLCTIHRGMRGTIRAR